MSKNAYASTCFGIVALGLLATAPAQAEFPEKPIEMTVLFGGSAQTVGQVLADEMSKALGSPVVAVSRPGGGGAVGYSYVQGTPADGYNIVWNSNSISTVHYQGNLPFDYTAFTPIARAGLEVPVVATRADSGWTSLDILAKEGKALGRPLKVGVSGLGSFTHIVSAALFDRLDVPVVYVPYGEGRAPAELLAGRVDVAIQWPGQFLPHVENGTLAMLCSTGKEPLSLPVEVPTCDSAGAPGMDMTMWRGVVAPAGTPPEVVEKLEAATKAAVESEGFTKAATNLGFTPSFLPAEEFQTQIEQDDAVIAQLMTDLGLKN